VLKFSYADDFDLSLPRLPLRQRLTPSELWLRSTLPDRKYFIVECRGAWRAASFHAEVAIPEELRVDFGVLYDFGGDSPLSRSEEDVNRLSVYSADVTPGHEPGVFLRVSAHRGGRPIQAAVTSLIVALLLWFGVASGLDAKNPGAAVSILLAGAALFTGISAAQGEHRLLKTVFASSRRWLAVAAFAALAASSALAMEYPQAHPVPTWRVCAVIASVAAARLAWSAVRAPS
jgi:hypothetical protein